MTIRYPDLFDQGILQKRVQTALSRLESCRLCPRICGVNRLDGQTGFCRTGRLAKVYGFHAHFGEETPVSGTNGSGTVFFSYCSLGCSFCQNYEISHAGQGDWVTSDDLAEMMLKLQRRGCHNINFVTPTHIVPQILESLEKAVAQGLRIPLIYNTSAYDRVETLELLDGVMDIYMPDFKFWDPEIARMTCEAPNYPEIARQAILEMHRQVGDLVIDGNGIAARGLLVRHLVLPENMAGTAEVMHFLHQRISADTYVNVMFQYHPCGDISRNSPLGRAPTAAECREAWKAAQDAGIRRLDPPQRRLVLW
jgi:putative pyruvate formate lyase activating enzyme